MSNSATFNPQASPLRFRSYSPGCIEVNEKTFTKTILCQQDSILLPEIPNIEKISQQQLIKWQQMYQPELILVGTGSNPPETPPNIQAHCESNHIAFEVMTSKHCIRTLIALQSELRPLICILTP